jgi:hypothetical protein
MTSKLYEYNGDYFNYIRTIKSIDDKAHIIIETIDSSKGKSHEISISKELFESKFKAIDFNWPLKLWNEKRNNFVYCLGETENPLKALYGMPPDCGHWDMEVDVNFISHHFYNHLDKKQWFK